MAINDVLKDMYKKNTGKELTEEAHNVEDTLKAINRDIPLGGGGGGDNNLIVTLTLNESTFVGDKTFAEVKEALDQNKNILFSAIVVDADVTTYWPFIFHGLQTRSSYSNTINLYDPRNGNAVDATGADGDYISFQLT